MCAPGATTIDGEELDGAYENWMKLPTPTELEPTFFYGEHPLSGNKMNGLGERERRRAQYVFHSNAKTGPLPWDRMQMYFRYNYPFWALPQLLRNAWASFRPHGKLASKRREFVDSSEAAQNIKDKATELGAGIVGVCRMKKEFMVEGASTPYRYAISLGIPMRRDVMLKAPLVSSGMEVLHCYYKGSMLTVNLARYIRSLGWPAQGLPVNSSSECLHIPIALEAGLGQLGKHGSLICKEYGANFRLTSVLTDLPLEVDSPIDIAVDDLCQSCKVCVNECPPDAIFNEKQWVRGEEKWYVDFDKCVPYFSDNYGCAICLEVCPWSETGKGPKITSQLMKTRERRSRQQSQERRE